jgi:NADH-quinone oxidoreductase subunit N
MTISCRSAVILPEIVLLVFAMAALVARSTPARTGWPRPLWGTAALLALAIWDRHRRGDGTRLWRHVRRRRLRALRQGGDPAVGAAVLVAGQDTWQRKRDLLRFEYPLLIALATVGMMVMVSAGDLMTLYMGLELQSLALYVVAAMRRDSVKSTEAGLKYFVLGALSSGLLLYGASLTYGFAGTTLFAGIVRRRPTGELSLGLLFGLVLLSRVWPSRSPPRPSTCGRRMSTKARRPRSPPSSPPRPRSPPWPCSPGSASTPSAAPWRLAADRRAARGAVDVPGRRRRDRPDQHQAADGLFVDRAHGLALMGLAAGTAFGVQAMLVYMAIYVAMNVGTFAFILSMERDGKPVTDIARSTCSRRPNREGAGDAGAAVLACRRAADAGLLRQVLRAAAPRCEGGLAWLAVAGVIASVIGAFYYLRIVYYMYFGEEGEDRRQDDPVAGLWLLLMASAAAMLLGASSTCSAWSGRRGCRGDACQLNRPGPRGRPAGSCDGRQHPEPRPRASRRRRWPGPNGSWPWNRPPRMAGGAGPGRSAKGNFFATLVMRPAEEAGPIRWRCAASWPHWPCWRDACGRGQAPGGGVQASNGPMTCC